MISGPHIFILVFSFGLTYLTIPGLVWSPFAALICALIARSKGLNIRRYALSGAIHSSGFLLPWIYLMLRMYSISVPRGIVKSVYILLYTAWLIGPILYSAIYSLIVYEISSTPRVFTKSHDELIVEYVIIFISAASAAIHLYMWINSLRRLTHPQTVQEQSSDDSIRHLLIGDRYIKPFIFALISLWTWQVIFHITNWMETGCVITCQ